MYDVIGMLLKAAPTQCLLPTQLLDRIIVAFLMAA